MTKGVIGYRVWLVYIEDDGRPSLRCFNNPQVTRRWPYFGEGDAHFTMGVAMGGDTAGRSPEDQILCDDTCHSIAGCRNGLPLPYDWTPTPCRVVGCPEDRPRMTNTLGFHAYKTMAHLLEAVRDDLTPHTMKVVWPEAVGHVLAEVWLWGHIVEHETGWRGEYSRPHRLHEFVQSRTAAPVDVIHQLECLYLDIEATP